jgi:hypothetical protein
VLGAERGDGRHEAVVLNVAIVRVRCMCQANVEGRRGIAIRGCGSELEDQLRF